MVTIMSESSVEKKGRLILICRGDVTPPVAFGLKKLTDAAEARGLQVVRAGFWGRSQNVQNTSGDSPKDSTRRDYLLLTGKTGERFVEMTLARGGVSAENKPEGVVLARCPTGDGQTVTVCGGTDERGVLYALCELAARVVSEGPPALELAAAIGSPSGAEYPVSAECPVTIEYPAIAVRVAGRFIMSERDDTWYFSDDFWTYYAARLAENRINRLQLITGFDTAYMSPPYPFLVKTPGYESVVGIAGKDHAERRGRCLAMLRRIGRTLHDHGVEFCFGIWQQKPWTSNQDYLVENSPPDDLFADYAQKSIAELLIQCPEIDTLSFRVNMEAGVKREKDGRRTNTAEEFWFGMIDSIAGTGRRVGLDLRAKGLTDAMIAHAADAGLNVTVPTKAWCEHIGLPYQMLQLRSEEMRHGGNFNGSRRYSYDDLQRQPRTYDLQYRLWNYGSTNLLLWGEPYHVSRFIKSCLAAQATGFEFTVPLSLKG
ncbi:MAG: hypothetical protein LBU58_12115, partial [Clostridiales bacterium]|nr:hypothetical protein [Clostridiales bacterium]